LTLNFVLLRHHGKTRSAIQQDDLADPGQQAAEKSLRSNASREFKIA
jgi:hypothetical protein